MAEDPIGGGGADRWRRSRSVAGRRSRSVAEEPTQLAEAMQALPLPSAAAAAAAAACGVPGRHVLWSVTG